MQLHGAEAIEYAHQHGVVHCDLKPSNVLRSNSGQIYVTDFGFAQLLDTDGKEGRTLGGTPAFMAPEQLQAGFDPSPAVDVYGIGAVLFSLLTAHAPMNCQTIDGVLSPGQAATEPRRPGELRSGIPDDVEQACMRCLARMPADRFSRAADVATALHG